jgi:serine/threonine protein kinase
VLVNDQRHACLADFGLAAISDATAGSAPLDQGSLRWMAPELLFPTEGHQARRSQSSDVYALGSLFLEVNTYSLFSAYDRSSQLWSQVCTGRSPYDGLFDGVVIRLISEGRHPDRPAQNGLRLPISDWFWGLLKACWVTDPFARPSVKAILDRMKVVDFGVITS